MGTRRKTTPSQSAATVEPTIPLWVALASLVFGLVVHYGPFHGGGAAGMGTMLVMCGRATFCLAQEANRQPARCLEYSLATNAMMLLLPSGVVLAAIDASIPLAQDVFLGGCILAVAAAVIDCAAKRADRRASGGGAVTAP